VPTLARGGIWWPLPFTRMRPVCAESLYAVLKLRYQSEFRTGRAESTLRLITGTVWLVPV
jgi:hypothetical protein